METIKGTINRIIFSSPDKAYKVLLLNPRNIVTGEFGPEIIPETVATFHGDYKNHPKYGSQFRCESYEVFYNAEELSSIRLFIDAIAPNIGSERSMAITSHFKEDTIRVLDEEPERLIEVDGIGKVSAESLMKAWKENRDRWNDERKIYSLRAFLLTLGIKEKRIRRILGHFGTNGAMTEDKIKEDPYILTDVDGFAFSTVDFIARRLHIPEDSPSRARAFIRHLLNTICPSMGHLYYTRTEIRGIVSQYCASNTTKFLGKDNLEFEDIDPILGELCKDKYVVIDDDCVYSTETYKFENESAVLLSQIIKTPSDLIFLNKDAIKEHILKFEKENNFILSPEQREALYLFAEKKVFVITGGPGTGKTSILKAIVELAINMKLHLTCMTPTGISAKKLSETVKYDAYTIHRRLGYRGNSWSHNDLDQYDTDVAIIDEASMLDMDVCYHMLLALKKRTHIIFVGDQYQLPSVGAGNVLKELIKSEQIPVVRLEKIFRQDEASDIIKVAHQVKNGIIDFTLFSQDPKADVFFYREKDLNTINTMIVSMAQKFKAEKRLFQIISPRNTGPLGVDTLNETLQAVLNPPMEDLKEIKCRYFTLRRGDRVIVRKNDYENEIFNGDIGKITFIGPEYVTMEIDERSVFIDIDEIDNKIKLAYAITVHKCVHKNSLVFSKPGLTQIKELKIGDRVYSGKGGLKKVLNKSCEEKPGFLIETGYGYTLKASAEHPILVGNENGVEFKKIKDIGEGDFVCIDRKSNIVGKNIKLHFKNTYKKRLNYNRVYKRTELKLPLYLTKDISWLLGALVGDGCYTDRNDGIIELTGPADLEILEEAKRIGNELGLRWVNHYKKGKLHGIYTISKNFRGWLLSIGMGYKKAPLKFIPKLIFSANNQCRAAFIKGLFDTDGSIAKDRPLLRFTSSSKKLINDLQLLLLTLGIISYKNSQGIRHHKLCISGKDFLLYKESVGFFCYRKYKDLKTQYNKLKNSTRLQKTSRDFIPYGKKIATDIINCFKVLKSRGKLGLGFNADGNRRASHFYLVKSGKCKLSYFLLQSILGIVKKQGMSLSKYCFDCVDQHYFFDTVKHINQTHLTESMVDIEVSEDHSFVANGFVCHNCQGLEYSFIILPFINQFGKLILQRNLLYTAITRAKEKVIILGHGSAIERAINNSSVERRNTKLGERITKCLIPKKKFSSQQLQEMLENSPDMTPKTEQSLSNVEESCLTASTSE